MDVASYGYLLDLNNNGLFDHPLSDISAYVVSKGKSQVANWNSGRSSDVDFDAAGTCSVLLDNSTSIFSPNNIASALYGLILPNQLFKITMTVGGTTTSQFQGYIDEVVPTVGEVKGVSTARLTAYDILSQFTESEAEVALQENETTGALATAFLTACGLAAGEMQIDTGQSTLSKWWKKKDQSDIDTIRQLQAAELGRFRVGKNGKLYFEDRNHIFAAPHAAPQATYGTGTLNIWNLRQGSTRAGVYPYAKSQVRTFNKSEDSTLVIVTDVANNAGGAPLIVPAGGTLDVWIELPDTSPYISVESWSTVDYEANTNAGGTGTDITTDVSAVKTSYGPRQKVVFTNANGSDAYLVVLRANGVATVEGDPVPIMSPAARPKGAREYPNPSEWVTDQTEGQAYLDYLVATFGTARPTLTFDVKANYDAAHLAEVQARQTGDRIRVVASLADFGLGIDGEYVIDSISRSIDAANVDIMTITCTPAPASALAASGTAYTAKTIPADTVATLYPPDDLWTKGLISGDKIVFTCQARKWNADIAEAEFRAKLIPPGQTVESVNMKTVAEGGSFADNGTTQIIKTGLYASWRGVNLQHFFITASPAIANLGRWYFAFRLKNSDGWSTWTDGNLTPQYVVDYVDTEADNFSDAGPAADFTVTVKAGSQSGTAIVVASRPQTYGKRIWFVEFQIRDATSGSWRNVDANAGAALTHYDGSAISHTYDPVTGTITKASGDYGDGAVYGGLMLVDRRQGQFDQLHCTWIWVTAAQISGSTITGVLGASGAFEPDENGLYTNLRIKIVKTPKWWNNTSPANSDGYCAEQGMQDQQHWENETCGDLTSPTFTSAPFILPSGVALEDIQARVWFGTDYSFSDGGVHSGNGPVAGSTPPDAGVVQIPSAATITLDCGLGSIFYVTLDQDATLANFINCRHGRPVIVIVRQDAAGGHSLTLDTKFNYGTEITASAVVIAQDPGARSYFGFIYDSDADLIDVVAFVSGYQESA